MKGILFKPDMVKAIVEGRKTVTRRLLNPQPFMERGVLRWQPKRNYPKGYRSGMHLPDINMTDNADLAKLFSPYKVGKVVYIKEAWATEKQYDHLKPRDIPHTAKIFYTSDGVGEWPINLIIGKLRSPMFMPAWAARDFITITDVKHERLQSITPEDCIAEGYPLGDIPDNRDEKQMQISRLMRLGWYQSLWDSINPKYPFDGNYWAWRICFNLIEGKR